MSLLSESAYFDQLAETLVRESGAHELRMVQAREDIAALRPVRWCGQCQRQHSLCWFHTNFESAQKLREVA